MARGAEQGTKTVALLIVLPLHVVETDALSILALLAALLIRKRVSERVSNSWMSKVSFAVQMCWLCAVDRASF